MIVTMHNLIPLIAACLGISFGYLEGFIWHIHEKYVSLLNATSKSKFIHNALVVIKCIIGIAMFPTITTWVEVISGWCFYFYLHQSTMYHQRSKLNYSAYPFGWWSDGSDSSESFLDIKFPIIKTHLFRLSMFFIGILLWIFNFINYLPY